MLVLTCKPGECLLIELEEGACADTPARQLLADGPIKIGIGEIRREQIRIGVQAPRRLKILRAELARLEPISK